MLKKSIMLLVILLVLIGAAISSSYTFLKTVSLFDEPAALWVLLGVSVLGLVSGSFRGLLKKRAVIQGNIVKRHGIGSFIAHWYTAFGIFVLISSGIITGFLTVPPFAKTVASVIPAINMHYFALNIILFSGLFFLADYTISRDWFLLIPNLQDITGGFIGKYFLHRKWSKEDKYLSSQKDAFVPFAAIGLVMLTTGAIKVAAHIWTVSLGLQGWATIIHDSFMVLTIFYLFIHVGIVVLMKHWPAFFSWFTGTMPEKLVEDEFPVWYKRIRTSTE
jgi:cytochrome b subunit of formate dehydrogenase